MRRLSLATLTGLEPATSAVTGRRANQLRHRALLRAVLFARERTLVDAMQITQISHHQIDRALLSCGFCAAAASRTGPRDRGSSPPAGRARPARPHLPRRTCPHAPVLASPTHPSSPPPSYTRPRRRRHNRTPQCTPAPAEARAEVHGEERIPAGRAGAPADARGHAGAPADAGVGVGRRGREAESPDHHDCDDRDRLLAYPLRDSNPRRRRERPVS